MREEQLRLYLPKKVAHYRTKKSSIVLDPAHEDGIRPSPDFEGNKKYFAYGANDYVRMVKRDSSIGGRGPSKAECAYGRVLKDIAESDFPFIELEEFKHYGAASCAYLKHPLPLPKDIELKLWEKGWNGREELRRVYFRYSYRGGLNQDRIGYIIRSPREDLLTNTHEVVA